MPQAVPSAETRSEHLDGDLSRTHVHRRQTHSHVCLEQQTDCHSRQLVLHDTPCPVDMTTGHALMMSTTLWARHNENFTNRPNTTPALLVCHPCTRAHTVSKQAIWVLTTSRWLDCPKSSEHCWHLLITRATFPKSMLPLGFLAATATRSTTELTQQPQPPQLSQLPLTTATPLCTHASPTQLRVYSWPCAWIQDCVYLYTPTHQPAKESFLTQRPRLF